MSRHASPDGSVEYDAETDTYRTSFEVGERRPSTAIIHAVAELTDRELDALDPLYTVIDGDALDTLVRSTVTGEQRGDSEVTFNYHGYEITVRSYGRIMLESVKPS